MTTEFDRVFDQMEAPEYPATCDKCGYEATNAEIDQHICNDAPAAPERGERNDKMYSKSSRQTRQHVHFCMFCGQSGTELGNEQHSTLIAQRERLLEALRGVRLMLRTELKPYQDEPWARRVNETYDTTVEQEGST